MATPPAKTPLRVALFTGNFNYTRDGSTQALGRLVDHLRRVEGAQVRIYSPTSPEVDAQSHEGLVSVPSVTFPGRAEYRLALGLTSEVRRDVADFAPDIVHLSTPDILGAQAQQFARQIGAPVVASLHTRFETYLAYYGLGWLEPVVDQMLRRFYARSDFVLAPSRPVADTLVAEGLTAPIRIWSRGVDRDLFDPARRDMAWRAARGFRDDDLVVLFFGRVVMEKGLAPFADIVDRLRAGSRNIRVLVVGDGPARPWLAERLPSAVFTGFLAGEDLARAVASADVLFNPSATEAFGNVNLEGMASGLPVVCADLPSGRALLKHGVSGLLCDLENPDSYVNALARLALEPAFRGALGAAAREASAAFSWSAALASVVDVYREAIAKAGARQTTAA